jgi:hypothetical protein
MSIPTTIPRVCGCCETNLVRTGNDTWFFVEYQDEEDERNKYKYFCDVSCERKYVRDTTIDHYKEKYEAYKDIIDIPTVDAIPVMKVFKKYIVAEYIFYKSLLERKPRSVLTRLLELRQKAITDMCEVAHEEKNDELLFKLGDDFKTHFEGAIDAWCAPEAVGN